MGTGWQPGICQAGFVHVHVCVVGAPTFTDQSTYMYALYACAESTWSVMGVQC